MVSSISFGRRGEGGRFGSQWSITILPEVHLLSLGRRILPLITASFTEPPAQVEIVFPFYGLVSISINEAWPLINCYAFLSHLSGRLVAPLGTVPRLRN